MILVQSFEYFTYEVSPLRGQPRLFVVRPAWGYDRSVASREAY